MTSPDSPVVPLEQTRDKTIDALSLHFAHDALSLEELERRLELAYRARSVAELRALTADLEPVAERSAVPAVANAPVSPALAPDHEHIRSIMAETKRLGVWAVAQRLDLTAVMSDTTIDLTQAVLPAGIVDVHVKAMMTDLKVILPPGVRVANRLSNFMASVEVQPDDSPTRADLPVIRLTGWAVMASVVVKTRKREELLP